MASHKGSNWNVESYFFIDELGRIDPDTRMSTATYLAEHLNGEIATSLATTIRFNLIANSKLESEIDRDRTDPNNDIQLPIWSLILLRLDAAHKEEWLSDFNGLCDRAFSEGVRSDAYARLLGGRTATGVEYPDILASTRPPDGISDVEVRLTLATVHREAMLTNRLTEVASKVRENSKEIERLNAEVTTISRIANAANRTSTNALVQASRALDGMTALRTELQKDQHANSEKIAELDKKIEILTDKLNSSELTESTISYDNHLPDVTLYTVTEDARKRLIHLRNNTHSYERVTVRHSPDPKWPQPGAQCFDSTEQLKADEDRVIFVQDGKSHWVLTVQRLQLFR